MPTLLCALAVQVDTCVSTRLRKQANSRRSSSSSPLLVVIELACYEPEWAVVRHYLFSVLAYPKPSHWSITWSNLSITLPSCAYRGVIVVVVIVVGTTKGGARGVETSESRQGHIYAYQEKKKKKNL